MIKNPAKKAKIPKKTPVPKDMMINDPNAQMINPQDMPMYPDMVNYDAVPSPTPIPKVPRPTKGYPVKKGR